MKRWILIAAIATQAAGCGKDVQTSLWQQIKDLNEEKTELTLQVEQLQNENAVLTEQVKTLSDLDEDKRTAALVVPVTLRIGGQTGLYDKTNDGKQDTLVVHLEPLDAQQDAVKAAGTVDIELWNLTTSPEQAKLAQWHIGPEDLKSLWGRGLTSSYYRLTFPLDNILKGGEKELTVRARFTDYLTGRILTDQRVIVP